MSDSKAPSADIGRFLLLAAILPGIIYSSTILVFLPTEMAEIDRWMRSAGFESTWPAWTAFAIAVGLILSSICFCIEILLRNFKFFEILFPPLKFSALAEIEAQGKSTAYLNQLLGQAFMHFNIWLGITLIILGWLTYKLLLSCSIWTYVDAIRLVIGDIIVLANLIVASFLYTRADDALNNVLNDELKDDPPIA